VNLPLFCYGTLLDVDMLACVVGETAAAAVTMETGWLAGYRKARLPHENYPLLVPEAESFAQGALLYGLQKPQIDRIVFFEGEEYELSPCKVKTEGSKTVDALFFDEGIMPPPRTEEWCLAHWQKHHKQFMIRQSREYMSYYGLMSAVEADIHWQNYQEQTGD